VTRLSYLDESERSVYSIADDKLTELAEWDECTLRGEIAGLLADELDLSILWINDEDLDALLRNPDRLVLNRGDSHWQNESCWHAVKKTGKGHWAGDRKRTTLWHISCKSQNAATGTRPCSRWLCSRPRLKRPPTHAPRSSSHSAARASPPHDLVKRRLVTKSQRSDQILTLAGRPLRCPLQRAAMVEGYMGQISVEIVSPNGSVPTGTQHADFHDRLRSSGLRLVKQL